MSGLIQPKTLSDIQDAVAASIKSAELLAAGAKVEPSPGILTEAFLSKNAVPRSGAAFVGIGRIAEVGAHANGAQMIVLRLGVFLVPPSERRAKQSGDLADLVGAATLFVDGNRFGLAGANKPSGLFAANHYSPSLDKKGTTIWQIEWQQTFHLFDAEGAVTQRQTGGTGA
jgi:hypothetical protein